ncbi:head-tail connector protein [Labrys sp. KB_33_2]|uniref:head-tail connector protein n=1 Tax=Labrys sp. KB_33_2 TaxID=3237479 RepID=UPI003F8F3453
MRLSVVTPAAEPGITVDDAKRHLRVEHTEDDTYIAGLIEAAFVWIDAPDGWLGRAVREQGFEARFAGFCQRLGGYRVPWLSLPLLPVSAVTSVIYLDDRGNEQPLAPADYRFADTELRPAPGKSWPVTLDGPDTVRVRFTAGYADIPAPIRQAVLLLVGQWYVAREAVGKSDQAELPFAVSNLLSPYRVWTV